MANKPQTNQVERRIVTGDVRAKKADAGPTVLSGYAALFNRETVIEGWFPFREVIQAGAFAETIKTDDVRGLFNHDSNYVLGRTSNGTVRLTEDTIGLQYEIDLNAADPDAMSVGAKVERGDVSQSSFAFQVAEDKWDESEVKLGKLPLRTIIRVAPLYDVSAVTFPAYGDTTVSARAEARAKELTAPEPTAEPADSGKQVTVAVELDREALTRIVARALPSVLKVKSVIGPAAPVTFAADPDSRVRELEIKRRG